MNRNEAKSILEVYRPGDEAAGNPRLAEALALARTDAELAAWLARDQKWDALVRQGLRALPVPAGLRANVLAEQKVVALPTATPGAAWFTWRSPVLWAMAAGLMLLAGVAAIRLNRAPANNLNAFAQAMISAAADSTNHVDVHNQDLKEVKGWLGDHHNLADITLPPALGEQQWLAGCRALAWKGHPVAMLCFLPPHALHVDLFVTAAANLSDPPLTGQPVFQKLKDDAMVAWVNDENLYVLAGAVPEGFLRQCLSSAMLSRAGSPTLLAARQ